MSKKVASKSRDNVDVDETKGGVSKKKAAPAHVGQWNIPGEHEETLRKGAFPNREAGVVKESGPKRVQAARQETHGKLINADGTSQATPGTKVARLV